MNELVALVETARKDGVIRFLANPRTRQALTLALSVSPAPRDPHAWAVSILTQLAMGLDHVDGIDCGTPIPEQVP